jgi:excisionase family DNA binding protein
MDDVRLLRIGEVADLLRISRTKVYELMSSGEIPSLHVGRSRRVPLRALAQ